MYVTEQTEIIYKPPHTADLHAPSPHSDLTLLTFQVAVVLLSLSHHQAITGQRLRMNKIGTVVGIKFSTSDIYLSCQPLFKGYI